MLRLMVTDWMDRSNESRRFRRKKGRPRALKTINDSITRDFWLESLD